MTDDTTPTRRQRAVGAYIQGNHARAIIDRMPGAEVPASVRAALMELAAAVEQLAQLAIDQEDAQTND